MRWPLCLVPLVLLGCTGNRSGGVDNSLTLCIENATAGYGNVVARVESARFEVRPGQTLCRRIGTAGNAPRLTASTVGGGISGQLRFRTTLPGGGAGCWRWQLSGRETEGALLPCREGEGF